jgi:very-short-patch-repair endonuclease
MAKNIINWLIEEGFDVEIEKTFDWFYDKNKPKGRFRLDAFLSNYNMGIEYDGEQHFKPCFTSKYETVDKIKKRDMLKTKLCKEHNVKLVRFKYDEIITKDLMLMKIYAEL